MGRRWTRRKRRKSSRRRRRSRRSRRRTSSSSPSRGEEPERRCSRRGVGDGNAGPRGRAVAGAAEPRAELPPALGGALSGSRRAEAAEIPLPTQGPRRRRCRRRRRDVESRRRGALVALVFSLRAGVLCFARGACLSLGIFFPWLVHSCQLARFSAPSRQSPLLSPLLCGRLWLVVHRVLKRVSARVRALWTMPMPISDFSLF